MLFLNRLMVTKFGIPLLVLASGRLSYAAQLCITIQDPTSLPLRNAWIRIIDLHSQHELKGEADREGHWCSTKLPEGVYSVETGLQGFLNVRYLPVHVTYPGTNQLTFRLPVGEITEGGVGTDATISGTLQHAGETVPGARICLFKLSAQAPAACTATNRLGEYALTVATGAYRAEITDAGKVHRSALDLSSPGHYRDALQID